MRHTLHLTLLLALLALGSCQPKGKTPEQEAEPARRDTLDVLSFLDSIYLLRFDDMNHPGKRKVDYDSAYSTRLFNLWADIPDGQVANDADVWTGVQDYDNLIYYGAELDTIIDGTAWARVNFSAFNNDDRVARIRMVQETRYGRKSWTIDDFTHLSPTGEFYSIYEEAQRSLPNRSVYYHWPPNAYDTHYEDNFIELRYYDDELADGFFWGTSDEFYEAREGFLPGFIVLPMQDLTQQADTLSFTLNSTGELFFSGPVPMSCHRTSQARHSGCHLWVQPAYESFYQEVHYQAILSADTLRVLKDNSFWPYYEDHPFVRCTTEALDTLVRTYKWEKDNRRQH